MGALHSPRVQFRLLMVGGREGGAVLWISLCSDPPLFGVGQGGGVSEIQKRRGEGDLQRGRDGQGSPAESLLSFWGTTWNVWGGV